MANYFDQFDTAPAKEPPKKGGNYFDQFDTPEPAEGFKPPEGVRGRPYIPTKEGVEGARKTIEFAKDVGRAAGAGAIRGTAGAIPDITNLGQQGVNWLTDKVFQPSEEYKAKRDAALTRAGSPEMIEAAGKALGTQLGTAGATTPEGKAIGPYGETVAGFAGPGALMKVPFIGRSLVPGIVSEYLGQQAQGTPLELPARVAGSFVGKGGPQVPGAMPNYVQGPIRTAVANKLAEVPFVGAGIRRAADETVDAFGVQAAALPMKPTGGVVNQAVAGKTVQDPIREAIATKAELTQVPMGTVPHPYGNRAEQLGLTDLNARREAIGLPPVDKLPAGYRGFYQWKYGRDVTGEPVTAPVRETPVLPTSIKQMESTAPENVSRHLIKMAKTNDLDALGTVRAGTPEASWPQVQGAFLAELGAVRQGRQVSFDGGQLLQGLRELSPGGMNIMFGDSKVSLRRSIDSILADSKHIRTLLQTPSRTSVRSSLAVGAGLMTDPMSTLGAMVGGRVLASLLSSPATAASLAGWSRAFTNFMVKGGTPATIAALKMATTNLENTAGIKLDPERLKSHQPQRAEESVDWGPYTESPDQSTLQGIVEQGSRMYPRGIDWKNMRRSTNVENRREGSGYVMPNTESREQILKDNALWDAYEGQWGPAGETTNIERQGGLADLESQLKSRVTIMPRPRPRMDSARQSKATEERDRQLRNAKTARGQK